MTEFLIVAAALLLDHLLGEARRWHPLVGFGKLVNWLEQKMNTGQQQAWLARSKGLLALFLLLTPFALLAYWLEQDTVPGMLAAVMFLYLAIGARSLRDHARQVCDALTENRLDHARRFTGYLVSRETKTMSETDMSRATIESTLENGSDAIFAPIFWFVVAGIPGVMIYRLSNTLDAMWGYRIPRFKHFGWAAARLDDALNFIPARLTAVTYAFSGAYIGNFSYALRCWRSQAKLCESPNAGPVMASGAGALALQLGGPAIYHGTQKNRPWLGVGKTPKAQDIEQAIALLNRSIYCWLVALLIIYGVSSLA